MRHAFLLIAHNEFQLLKILLSMLDDERNDIFLHIDKKVDMESLNKDMFILKHARLYILEQRIDVRWGDISVVKVELLLLETARMKGPYDYYHLLSGVDLPIKSQDYIHEFFEKNKGYEFVAYSQGEANLKDLEWKMSKYHLFTRYYKIPPRFFRKKIERFRRKFLKFQEKYHYSRPNEIDFKKGSNWVSISDDLVTVLLDKKNFIFKRFKYVCCSDEIFIHSILWNSPLKDKIYKVNREAGNGIRAIDWNRGDPYVWRMEDLSLLLESDDLFARKFSSDDMEIVMKVKELFS
ncbi:beta-1,6-N-acetylglucosaminyltransferase [Bacteroides sp.]|uniref:beta-1,6-N-acetylglucosaminyltransferase n=1 Tax=Bacteroides sp. TaxID=29523 RepID=UPI00262A6D59|nr:beta-1,6-N-acetylglucosaminyltransferase [Bacteroides sp.]MDD3036333.1 beta-1,6-N-acetylglucosaminyltransferase [Bacteroides sp.]